MPSLSASLRELSRAAGTRAVAMLAEAVRRPNLLGALAFVAVYVVLEWITYSHEYRGVPVTPWNPGVGVAFGLIVLKSAAYGLALLIGVMVAEIFVLQTQLA